jgi:hypothetical protein
LWVDCNYSKGNAILGVTFSSAAFRICGNLNEAARAGLRPSSDGFGFKLIHKRDQPSLPVETPMGDWKSVKTFRKNYYGCSLSTLKSPMALALYEKRIFIPQWSSRDI